MRGQPEFSADDVEAIVSAVAGDFAGASLAAHARGALELLRRVVPHAAFNGYLVHRGGPAVPVCQGGLDQSGLEDYPLHYVHADPMQKTFGDPASQAATLSGCARAQGVDLRRCEFVQDFLLPRFGIAHTFGSNFLLDEDVTFTFAIHRDRRSEDFNARNLKTFKIALPHLARSLRITHARERATEFLRVGSDHARRSATSGLAVFDGKLECREANPFARSVLLDLESKGSLDEVLTAAAALVRRLIHNPWLSFADASFIRQAERGLVSIRIAAQRPTRGAPITVFVLLDLVRSRLKLLTKRLARPFGLTEKEVEIVSFLHEGLPQRAIAKKLEVHAETVRHHLVAVRRKLGVRTNEQILTRLLGIA